MNDYMVLRRLALTVVWAYGVSAAWAMPTKTELAQAQQLVQDLTAEDLRAMKAGTKKPGEVAATQLALAGEAETEAGKYLLLQGAFKLYARAADYDAAADVLTRMRKEIADLPPEVVVELVNGEMRRVAAEKAPKVLAIFRDAQRTMKCRKELAAAESAAQAKPDDKAAQRRLAECYVGLDDWAKALEIFAKIGDEAAKFEQNPASAKGFDAMKAANYWWEYAAKDAEPFKAHAAALYKKGFEDGSITGLRKTLAEKRIKEMEGVLAVSSSAPRGSGAPVASGGGAAEPDKVTASTTGSLAIPVKVKTHTIKLNNKVNIEFVECPAGTFTMGYEKDEHSPNREHKVTITRPFWIARTKLTLEQYKAYDRKFKPCDESRVMDGDKSPFSSGHFIYPRTIKLRRQAEAYCEYLTKKFRNAIPKGYVFRLPSDAEWEYAYTAGETNPDDFYGMSGDATKRFPKEELEKYMITDEYIQAYAAKVGKKYGKYQDETGVAVGKCKPNRWGLYDMAGNTAEMVLDTLDRKLIDQKDGRGFGPKQTALVYEDEETDPLRCFSVDDSDDEGGGLVRSARGGNGGKWRRTGCPNTFRLVVGPDLVTEKKAAAKK